MKLHRSLTRGCSLLTLALPLTVGCGGGDAPSSTTAGGNPPQVAAPLTQNPAAQATATIVADGAQTEAAESVAIFLDSLRRGNETAANGVLTQLARTELAKTSYVIQPLGTPNGQFKIGRVSYPYEVKDVALVECTWLEPAADAEPAVSMDIVCEVHQEAEGWRISGIAVSIPETEDALVLDFEDAIALQNTIDQATGQSSPQQPAASPQAGAAGLAGQLPQPQFPQQTAAPNSSLPPAPNLQQQLPAGPNDSQGNVQIALPQLPGATIQR